METTKNAVKSATSSDSQFQQGELSNSTSPAPCSDMLPGYQVPIQHLEKPGSQGDMKPSPTTDHVPTEEGGYQIYKAAGKLKDKKAIITGGDSGIGRAVAVLFAMEGADSLITYLPEEERDAQETKRRVEEIGGKCIIVEVDLKDKKCCQEVVDTAVEQLGGLNVLVNNAGTQTMIDDIKDLSE